ncbi:Z-ring formation inhibitor MciZ [Gorillibacterium sp. CAU 1737]|uniref:Z-ring formation inhibitor MciZ n=1 Tax=Gorillibacterium sp. CAU 1737 TaxID=3140362 RepID=UPI003260DF1B
MKVYVTNGGMRMVGKAWEVRNKLKEMAKETEKQDVPFTSLLPKTPSKRKSNNRS